MPLAPKAVPMLCPTFPSSTFMFWAKTPPLLLIKFVHFKRFLDLAFLWSQLVGLTRSSLPSCCPMLQKASFGSSPAFFTWSAKFLLLVTLFAHLKFICFQLFVLVLLTWLFFIIFTWYFDVSSSSDFLHLVRISLKLSPDVWCLFLQGKHTNQGHECSIFDGSSITLLRSILIDLPVCSACSPMFFFLSVRQPDEHTWILIPISSF